MVADSKYSKQYNYPCIKIYDVSFYHQKVDPDVVYGLFSCVIYQLCLFGVRTVLGHGIILWQYFGVGHRMRHRFVGIEQC